MDKRTIIHMFDPMPHTSPFDINMAADAGFDVVVPYNNVELDRIHRLVQDAIFSRGPAGVKRTAIFIGGRDAGIEVLNAAVLAHARQLNVAGDVNAVPPLGIEGIKFKALGAPLKYATASKGAVGIGALAVGDVKYNLQQALLRAMLDAEQPVYLDFRDAFQRARCLV